MKALMLFLPVALIAGGAQAQNLPPRIAQAMRILPPSGETLAVAQGTYTIPASLKGKSESDLLQVGLSNLQLGIIAPNLRGRTIELSMEARSHFRPPKGLGLMPYDGCGLLYLKPQKGETRAALEMKLLKTAKKTALIAGQRVGIFEDKREHDIWRIYVAVPQAGMVMLATDRSSLETTLARLKAVASLKDSAFPASWSGWKWVDTKASFWAIRRLDLPESMGIPEGRKKDKSAKAAVVFSRGDAKAHSFVMRYEGDQEYARRLFTSIARELPGKFQLLPHSSVAQFSVPNVNNGYFTFYALGFLGTGIYL